MSYSQPVAESRKRPGVVTAAGYLMFVVAALLVVNTVVSLTTMGTVVDATKKAYAAAPNADAMATAAQIGAVVGVIISLLFAAGFVVLGLFDLRGANPARIVTWVVAGISVLCFGCGLIIQSAQGSFTSGMRGNVNGVDVQAATKQIQDAIPSWVQPVQITSGVLTILLVIAVIVLLAVPAANAYFRKRPEDVVVNDPAFPQYPYPPAQ